MKIILSLAYGRRNVPVSNKFNANGVSILSLKKQCFCRQSIYFNVGL